MQVDTFAFGEFEVETTDDAGTTDDGGPAKGSVGEMIVGRDGKDAKFVIEDAVQDVDNTSGDTVIGGAFFLDDIVGFVTYEVGNVGANAVVEEFGDWLATEIGK